ncbi:MAG TPA: ATP-binding protein, partial [Pyrinomonadaceae bacterium]|nr:ATP-binding protein [Pyrinomonadaceae bacterium]
YTIYRYRLKRLLELERIRTRIATDLHDDIGSSLSQIAILSEVVRQKVGDNGANKPLNMIADTSRELVDSMSDIVWAINPNKDSFSDLVKRMRRFASDVLEAKDILFKFEFSESSKNTALGADIRREVYLMFKECINNLAKHSEATNTEISILIEGNNLAVKIKDNGRGFYVPPFDEHTTFEGFGGNGLFNLKRRTENLGGKFQIDSEIGKGTTVSFEIPLKEKKWLPSFTPK